MFLSFDRNNKYRFDASKAGLEYLGQNGESAAAMTDDEIKTAIFGKKRTCVVEKIPSAMRDTWYFEIIPADAKFESFEACPEALATRSIGI